MLLRRYRELQRYLSEVEHERERERLRDKERDRERDREAERDREPERDPERDSERDRERWEKLVDAADSASISSLSVLSCGVSVSDFEINSGSSLLISELLL